MTWWNTAYPFRRQLHIDPEGDTFEEGLPISYLFSRVTTVDAGKMRDDLEDVVVLYDSSDDATPSWNVIGRDAVAQGENVIITFSAVEDITEENDRYYIYSGNLLLVDAETQPAYSADEFPIIVTPDTEYGLSFTNPGEDWRDGLSNRQNAKAAFIFRGPNVRLNLQTWLEGGIAKIDFDNDESVYFDTFSAAEAVVEAFERTSLDSDYHTLRITVTGDKSPKAQAAKIKIENVEYLKYISATSSTEELYSPNATFSIFVSA